MANNIETINFKTSDNVIIVGDYFKTADPKAPAVLLLHMMPADRFSWTELAKKLQQNGFQCLAIDLRGHGESRDQNGKHLNYRNFSDLEHQSSKFDVDRSVKFFIEKGIKLENISIIGASIGANLALDFAVGHNEIKAVVLLSPGLNYRGILTEPLAKNLKGDDGQSVFMAATYGDEYSADSVKKLSKIIPKGVKKEIKILEGKAHGTDMFEENLNLENELISWLKFIYFK
ncbi:MAG: alpha/beta fold hydrolase [Parcubacteria group bacterium]|nr:alpha/beta fold hydrolase [Parcubacteria group bacterium]